MKFTKNIFAIIMVCLMVLISEIIGEKEIIFPEIFALLIGSWVADKRPWKVTKIKMLFLMSLSAFAGIGIVRYINIPIYFQIAIALAFTSIFLIYLRSTMVPMISACILPIMLGTTSIIYPISVITMVAIILLVEHIFIKLKWVSTSDEIVISSYKEEIALWSKRITIFLILAIIPVLSHNMYFIAPPLIVGYIELTNRDSRLRKKPVVVTGLILFAALIGVFMRIIVCETFGLPLTLAAVLATVGVLIIMNYTKIYFPPAGAIAILPMILPAKGILMYPIMVSIGFIVLLITAIFCFPNREPKAS